MDKEPIWHSWRELLGTIISNATEKERLANALGVRTVTLTRWASGESVPRPQNMQQLLNAMPQYRKVLHELILQEFPMFAAASKDVVTDVSSVIPLEFYIRIVNTCAMTPRKQRFWSISTLILQQALGQLDPNRFGMAITIAQCMPSRDGKVRSLRERMGQGTPPWRANLENEPLFLGAESLAGYAIARGHLLVIQDRSDQTMRYPAQWVQWEESAVACPIYQEGLIAGCLLVSSTQQGYFHPFQQTLIERYAELLGLAFASEELYDSRDIELLFIPSASVQHVYRSRLREHVSALLLEASQQNRPLTVLEAEEMAWRQIEEELLAYPTAAENEHPE